ncbi:hypothetical protein HK100_005425 [Physocladia obscura]|uniref:SH3 domain-containing protein n=1 Tax=Physocladia obscura TaxID=109957 RepID=A0AAD5T5T1_9FUNG|nr:hypothetical protein HK100_005425 [Physocladia obscura]
MATLTLDATVTTATESSVQTVLVTASECVAYKAACEAVGRSECSGGTWTIGCSAGLTVANPGFAYATGVCARCLCSKKNAANNQTSVTQLLDDIPCLSTSTATNFTIAVSGSSPENSTVPLNNNDNNNSNNGSSSNSLTLPLTLSLAVIVVITVAAAVYFYMKRKNRRYERERRIPSPSALNNPSNSTTTLVARKQIAPPVATAPATLSHKPFLMSMWIATTTTTTNESKADNGTRLNTETTTVTIEAYPLSSLQKRPHLMINLNPPDPPPLALATTTKTKNTTDEPSNDSTTFNQQLQASPASLVQVQHTPYIPSDSFLTPKTNGATIAAVAVNRAWSLEEQWQWEQYQAAVQWHQWQLAQKEWQASQREYYMGKEEERKNKIAAGGGSGIIAEDDDRMLEDGRVQQQRKRAFIKGGSLGPNYRPSPLRVVSADADSTLSSRRAESLISREGSLISRTLSSNGAYGTLGVGGNATNRQSIDTFTNPLFNTGTSFGESFANSISRTTSRHSVGSSTKSAVASIIIATSPEWNAPLDLIQVGSPRSITTSNNNRSRSRISSTHRSTIEVETGSIDASGSVTSTYVTSSTFALGKDVSVITMTSVGDDGQPLITQILSSMPVIVQDSGAATATTAGGTSSSNATLNLSAFGNQGYDGQSSSPDFRVMTSASLKSSSKSYGSITETIPPLPTTTNSAISTAVTPGGKCFDEPSTITEHLQHDTMLMATVVTADLVDEDGQIKYPVRVAYVPEKEDELRLDVDDEVVVWHILEDGMCEGFCVGRRERGFFPVKVVLG